jgi:hypothetical protein
LTGNRNIMLWGQAAKAFVTVIFSRLRSSLAVSVLMLAGYGFLTLTEPVLAQQVSREQDIGDLRLGQRVKVDDGTCPAGQIKEISGTRMTSTGIVRAQKCIPRLGPKRK